MLDCAKLGSVNWDDVQVLLALLRGKKLEVAAKRLGVDTSTLSRRVARLEEQLGARLFVRTREGLKPTATAERLLPHAEAMEANVVALQAALHSGEERASGLVRIATTESLARILVVEGLLEVRRTHPDLVIEILGENRPVDLARGEADVAVRLAALKQASLKARCVGRTGVGMFASPGYLAQRALRDGDDLRGHDVLLPTGELSRLPEVEWLAAQAGVRVVFRSNSMQALMDASAAGLGLVPLALGWGDRAPGLVRARVLEHVPERKVWVVTHPVSSERLAVTVVVDRLVAIFERMMGT